MFTDFKIFQIAKVVPYLFHLFKRKSVGQFTAFIFIPKFHIEVPEQRIARIIAHIERPTGLKKGISGDLCPIDIQIGQLEHSGEIVHKIVVDIGKP